MGVVDSSEEVATEVDSAVLVAAGDGYWGESSTCSTLTSASSQHSSIGGSSCTLGSTCIIVYQMD